MTLQQIKGFSKLSKTEKINWLATEYFQNPEAGKEILTQYQNADEKLQKLHDEFSENSLSNFYLPFGIAPNFNINGKTYAIPMVIEESSVVAAACKAAKFWGDRGGFKTEVIGTEKIGQVHLSFNGSFTELEDFFKVVAPKLHEAIAELQQKMRKRGGGLTGLELRDKTQSLDGYFQVHARFQTADAMGANFINSCLEAFAEVLLFEASQYTHFKTPNPKLEVIMSILSNYVPNCVVRASVCCKISDLKATPNLTKLAYAQKFVQAVQIAKIEPYRAVTHNKGIMNGIDAVVLATGNDFRAIEACVHAYAAKDGTYSSLTHATIHNNEELEFWIEIPLALGTVGGLTSLHPMVKLALEILGNPSASELMEIIAVAGLAQNFGAVDSLITTGIQKGHMKMHLLNILNQFEASKKEKETLIAYFKNHNVSHSAVVNELNKLRS